MRNSMILILCCAFAYALAGDNRCPGGYAEGTTIDIGAYWYECRGGVVVPKGCLTEDRSARIELQETYDVEEFRMQCVLDSNGQITLAYKACVMNGREHSVGDEWDDGTSSYLCKRIGSYMRVEKSGCVDNGRRISMNEKIAKGEIVHCCKQNSNGIPTLAPCGCVGKDGHQYSIGDSFEFDRFLYMCTANSEKVYTKTVGCLHQGRRLGNSDRFVENDVIWECAVNDEKTDIHPSGCIQRSETGAKVERRLGCFWIEGEPPYQYQMTCKTNSDSSTAVKVVNKCVYKVTGGSYMVEPGCYTLADQTGVGCIRDSSENAKLLTFQMGSVPGGLRQC